MLLSFGTQAGTELNVLFKGCVTGSHVAEFCRVLKALQTGCVCLMLSSLWFCWPWGSALMDHFALQMHFLTAEALWWHLASENRQTWPNSCSGGKNPKGWCSNPTDVSGDSAFTTQWCCVYSNWELPVPACVVWITHFRVNRSFLLHLFSCDTKAWQILQATILGQFL